MEKQATSPETTANFTSKIGFPVVLRILSPRATEVEGVKLNQSMHAFIHPLAAYSRAFNFVEVKSTFYEIPKIKRIGSLRRIIPPDFELPVRCNKNLAHELKFESVPKIFEMLDKTVTICNILKAEILHFQTSPSVHYKKTNRKKSSLDQFF